MTAAYPIHPEVFDRLYGDWSTLAKFQRTRGVLRLMASVIHSLWEKGDRSPMILPSNIPIADPRVQFGDRQGIHTMRVPAMIQDLQAPIIYTIPLQLLAYHVAVLKGTDVDQPRNLAKSVTVE